MLGAYLLAQTPDYHSPFQFKHHYAHHVLDSEIRATLLEAIQARECVEITATQQNGAIITKTILPLCLRKSVSSERQWILGCSPRHYWTFRLACITSIKPKGKPDWDTNELRDWPDGHIWGISCKSKETRRSTPRRSLTPNFFCKTVIFRLDGIVFFFMKKYLLRNVKD